MALSKWKIGHFQLSLQCLSYLSIVQGITLIVSQQTEQRGEVNTSLTDQVNARVHFQTLPVYQSQNDASGEIRHQRP